MNPEQQRAVLTLAQWLLLLWVIMVGTVWLPLRHVRYARRQGAARRLRHAAWSALSSSTIAP